MNTEKIFFLLHKLGLIRIFAGFSHGIRKLLLENCGYNAEWITNQFCSADMVTDSFMHRFVKPGFFLTRGHAETLFIQLEGLLKSLVGFEYIFPVAQGRWAENLLIGAIEAEGRLVPNNRLFITTRTLLSKYGYRSVEIPVGGDQIFGGNMDTRALKEMLAGSNKGDQVAFIYMECCTNALGGLPVSMANMREIFEMAREAGVPVVQDPARLLENAVMIREFEPGYGDKTLREIAVEFLSYSDAFAMSLTKDFPTEQGALIGMRDPKLAAMVREQVMLIGDGLSVRNKALINRALRKGFRKTGPVTKRVRTVREIHRKLKEAGLPVGKSSGASGVFIRTNKLIEQGSRGEFPVMSFLATLYLKSGIAAAVNYSTPGQEKAGEQMIRLSVPQGGFGRAKRKKIIRSVVAVWNHPEKWVRLEKDDSDQGAAAWQVRYRPADD